MALLAKLVWHISFICVVKRNLAAYYAVRNLYPGFWIFRKKKGSRLLTSKPCKAQYALDALLLNQLYKTPRIPDAAPRCPQTMYGSECTPCYCWTFHFWGAEEPPSAGILFWSKLEWEKEIVPLVQGWGSWGCLIQRIHLLPTIIGKVQKVVIVWSRLGRRLVEGSGGRTKLTIASSKHSLFPHKSVKNYMDKDDFPNFHSRYLNSPSVSQSMMMDHNSAIVCVPQTIYSFLGTRILPASNRKIIILQQFLHGNWQYRDMPSL